MKDWKEDNIGNLVDVNAKTAGRSFAYETIEYLDTSSVTDGIFDVPQIIELKNAPSRAKRIVRNNDIILSTVRPNLKHFGFIKNPKPNTIVSTGYAVISAKNIDAKFLYYYLASDFVTDYLSLISENQTSAYPSFNPELIKKLKIQYPEKPETQQHIASILSAYDDLIEVNNQRIRLLEQTARELYREWFVRMRFPGYKEVKFRKGVPEGWEVKKLGDVIELAYGKSLKEENREGGKYPVYGSSGIVGYHNSFIAKAPGIVVGRKGNVGSVFWVTENFFAIDTAFFVKTSYSYYYIYFNLFNQHFIEADAAVPGLNRIQAYSNFILLPDDKSIFAFERIIGPIFQQIHILQQQNTQLRQIRDRLLPRLISGKLKVSESRMEWIIG